MVVKLYTIHCPQCNVLESKLKAKGIEFELIDDKDVVINKGKEVGLKTAPILEVDGDFMKFTDAVKWIQLQ